MFYFCCLSLSINRTLAYCTPILLLKNHLLFSKTDAGPHLHSILKCAPYLSVCLITAVSEIGSGKINNCYSSLKNCQSREIFYAMVIDTSICIVKFLIAMKQKEPFDGQLIYHNFLINVDIH